MPRVQEWQKIPVRNYMKDGSRSSETVFQEKVSNHLILLQSKAELTFHEDSYGYRPGKSALDAVGKARERCWKTNWCIDLDVRGFFDNIDHELMMKAVRFHTDLKWIHLYVERWLKTPLQITGGERMAREAGTPQGGVISPLLANIFLHHAFDEWMRRSFPTVGFERFADDVRIHCVSLIQAEKVLEAVRVRFKECRLELHPDKTKIAYCKDGSRQGLYKHESFDFLGYEFRPRLSKSREGRYFVSFFTGG